MDSLTRFLSKCDLTQSDCWLWMGALNGSSPNDYGKFFYLGKLRKAHHASWLMFKGDIPKGLCICHSCDVPRCVNPSHLYAATHKQNIADRHKRGRDASHKGVLNGRAVLTPSKVKRIRASRATYRAIATRYGISPITVWAIKANRLWKHLR